MTIPPDSPEPVGATNDADDYETDGVWLDVFWMVLLGGVALIGAVMLGR